MQRIPACSKYLQVGGASRAMQREPPTACNPPVLPLPMSRAYEWPEYNKCNFFFSSPSLLKARLYLSEDFWECDVCACVQRVCLCMRASKRKSLKRQSL